MRDYPSLFPTSSLISLIFCMTSHGSILTQFWHNLGFVAEVSCENSVDEQLHLSASLRTYESCQPSFKLMLILFWLAATPLDAIEVWQGIWPHNYFNFSFRKENIKIEYVRRDIFSRGYFSLNGGVTLSKIVINHPRTYQ